MARANQFHRAGNTFRRTGYIKIPIEERKHNKNKWKDKKIERRTIQKERIKEKRGGWWKKKFGRKKK